MIPIRLKYWRNRFWNLVSNLSIKTLLSIVVFLLVFVLIIYATRPKKSEFYPNHSICTIAERGLEPIIDSQTKLFIAIVSGHKSSDRRVNVRNTWLKWAKKYGVTYKFFVGRATKEAERERFEFESKEFRDIVQLSSPDSYDALTNKTLDVFDWVSHNVKGFDYMFKVDDDTFVRVDRVLNALQDKPKKRLYMGKFHKGLPTILRENYRNNEVYYPPEVKELLPFASGCAYILTQDLVKYLTDNQNFFIRYFNEDAAVGTWLFSVDAHRVHDSRITAGYNCSNDAIAIHAVKDSIGMAKLFSNSENVNSCLCQNLNKKYVK